MNPHNWGSSGAFTSSEEKARQIRSGESKMGDFDSKTVKQHKAQSEIQQQPSVSGRNTPSATSSSPSSLGSSGRRTPSSYPPPPPPSGSGSHTSSITPSSPLYEDEDTGTSHHEVGDKADESHPGDVGGSDKHAPSGGEGYGSEPGYVGGSDKGHESEPDDDGEPYSESELDELDDEGDEDAPSDGEGHGSKAGDVDGDDEDVPSSGEGHESESDDEDDSGDSSDGSEEYSDDNPPPLPPR